MGKGIIIGIIILILILIIVGVVLIVVFNCSVKNSLGLGLKCHVNEAISENDVNICNELSKPAQVSNCYGKYAVNKKDASVCNDIPNKPDIGGCYFLLASEPLNTILICKNLPEGVEKPNCQNAFIRTGVETSQEIACDGLETLTDRNYCYFVTALVKNNPSLCENVDNSEFATGIDDCYRRVEEQNSYN